MGSLSATTEATRFGKYSLVARLATGGMAEIYLARLRGAAGFEKLVCIKRILPHLARDRQFVAMFLDEARIAAQISHPNVCQVFELGEIEGSYYIAMEYLEGVPLACFRRLDPQRGAPDPRLIAGIAVQACEALHHTHQLRSGDGSVLEVVHRDISPQNLFVTVDGIVKVLDFGIAKVRDASVKTGTGAVKGTYAYMSPEQLRGERVDRRTDVFALGIVMWETLIGRYLFRRETEFLTFQAITTDPIDDVSALRPDVPAVLSEVIRTALSRNRDDRFPTARMLGEQIGAAIQPLAGSAISEAIARLFPDQLASQASLIRTARAGGSFSLDIERGPAVSDVTDLQPLSSSQHVGLASRLEGASQVPSASSASSPGRRGLPARLRGLMFAVAALVIGSAGAYAYMRVARPAVAPSPPPPNGSAVAAAVAPDAQPMAVPPVDAAPADATPADAAPSLDAAPTDAAAGAGSAAAALAPAGPGDRHAPAAIAVAPRPSGPPGFITIDSAPVYATISIDGKSYGETPLVNVSLSPGRHTVHAVAPSGVVRDIRVTIESGKTARPTRIEW